MIVPGSVSPLMWGQGDPLDEFGVIARSLRTRRSATGRLTRTSVAAPANPKIWTYSGWHKRGILGAAQTIMQAAADTNGGYYLRIKTDDTFEVGYADSTTVLFSSTTKLRDLCAHFHLCVVMDTTQAAMADRLKVWINGSLLAGTVTNVTLNGTFAINVGSRLNYIGAAVTTSGYAAGWEWDGLHAHMLLVDGQALGPTYFGQFHQRTGQWRPKNKATVKAVVDAGGPNSFFLTFEDPTNTTTICADASSKGNNWASVNISLTAGSTYDSTLDTPTSNYSVLSTLTNTAGNVPTNCNLSVVLAASASGIIKGTVPMRKGRTPAEFVLTAYSANLAIGFGVQSIGETSGVLAKGVGYYSTGQKIIDGVSSAYGAAFTTNDVIRAELDLDANTVTFYKNGASQGSIALPAGSDWVFAAQNGTSTGTHTITANFGQIPFTGTPTAGCIPNSTKSLPVNYNVMKGESAFVARADTGANIVATLSAAAGFANWIRIYKRRDSAEGWRWQFSDDSGNYMDSSSTAAKAAFPALAGTSYVGYALRVGADSGIATGRLTHVNGVADVIADGLGKSRKAIILKNEATGNWLFYHPDLTAGYLLYMNLQQVETADATISAVNSSGFTVAAALASGTYRWIAIAETTGFTKVGSYIDNASADGPFGFCDSPAMAFFKYKSAGTCDWMTYDTARSQTNVMAASLRLNSTAAEGTRSDLDAVSNGLKVRSAVATSDSINFTGAGGTHVYVSFAALPFRYANAR